MRSRETKNISVFLDAAVKERLDKYKAWKGQKLANILEEALTAFFDGIEFGFTDADYEHGLIIPNRKKD